ncbi:isoleucine--tRNA ligase [Flagellatimonas centrodinii]|nr:isoleucine--tRNA ligase [Flagellatimonas centrodinii]ULQ46818.1 isoleucine--tRNA ligase [Flagellatimonas centrodinii]
MSTDYKATLNLPETAFPMQAQLAKREPEMLARWQAEETYAAVVKAAEGAEPFWLVDGPPYANGDIHIGHAVNKVLKDIVVKAARLDGRQAALIPGWDCHGLPIELQVEKKFGKVSDTLSPAQFRAHCRAYAADQVQRQRVDFERLGILADWDHPYLTMQPGFEAEQLRVLATIAANGHVTRGFKPVHWCLDCGSSLAEAEVEYQDKTSQAIDVAFAADDATDLARRFGVAAADGAAFVIWTTTPWTLPANQAICVNPDLDYALVALGERTLIVAAELVAAVAARVGAEPRELARAPGRALVDALARHPFADRVVPVLAGEHVTLEAGTGLVHTAPAHGADDYAVGRAAGLTVYNPVAGNGVFIDGTPVVAGLHVRKADAVVIEALRERGALVHLGQLHHSYPHCWRHKSPLIQRATPQWFVSMTAAGLRDGATEAIRETQWIPAWGEARIAKMIEGRPDWCISRQRFWGVPMAVFVHRETQQLHPDTPALLRRVADAVAQEGLEAWFGTTTADWGVGDEYEKSTDTLDVWFDSGVVHQASFTANGRTPPAQADIYLEGSDQHRGWFQSSLLTSVAMQGHAPYKSVLTHGFTVDEQGRKMSKSLGNVVAPQKVTSTLGADVLRLWVASSDYSGEIAISDNLLKRIADAYRRIRNTARYLLGALDGFDPATDAVVADELVAVDAWAISEAARLQRELQTAYREREFHRVYHGLHNYCVNDLGGLYLDLLKDRLYTTPRASRARRSAQTALFHIAEGLVRWIAPILSFTADEIWRLLPGDRSASVFAQPWHRFPETPAEGLDWSRLQLARTAVKKVLEDLRAAGTVGSALSAQVTLSASPAMAAALAAPGDELRFWFMTSAAELRPAGDGVAFTLDNGDTLTVQAIASPYAKCERCWHYREDIGRHEAHPTLCGRCVDNVDGAGEHRRFI